MAAQRGFRDPGGRRKGVGVLGKPGAWICGGPPQRAVARVRVPLRALLFKSLYGGRSSMVEHWVVSPGVASSSLVDHPNFQMGL